MNNDTLDVLAFAISSIYAPAPPPYRLCQILPRCDSSVEELADISPEARRALKKLRQADRNFLRVKKYRRSNYWFEVRNHWQKIVNQIALKYGN